jgi:hypothetical protein
MRKFKLRHYPAPGIRNTRRPRPHLPSRPHVTVPLAIALKRGGLELNQLLGVHHPRRVHARLAGPLDIGPLVSNDPHIVRGGSA